MKLNKHGHRGYASALVLAVLALTTATEAKTWYVGGDGKADFRVLAAAIAAADNGDVIVIAPGVYAAGANIVGKVFTMRSRDPNDPAIVAGTVIDCQTSGGYAIGDASVKPAQADTRLTMVGLTFRGGARGTVLCDTAELTLSNCTFANGTTEWAGGALNCREGHVQATGCTFSNNVSTAARGGAIYCSGSRVRLTDCTFAGNRGCAIVNYDSELTLVGCRLQENSGEDGGAIHCRQDTPGAVSASLSLTRCTFLDNTASASGGATYCYYVRATANACTFTSNRSKQDGGAVFNSRGDVALRNCLFARNAANNNGGALSTWYGSNPEIVNCTFVANNAAVGGAAAINGQSQVLLSHSILWDNRAGQGKSLALLSNMFDYGGDAVATIEYSDVAGGREGIQVASGAVLNWSRGNLDADPVFWSSHDCSLGGRSPCIDAGDPSYAPGPSVLDVAGNPRQSGATVDLGAFEAGPAAVYRFWSPLSQRHFYTISRGERDKLIDESEGVWEYESIAFYASTRSFADMLPVHRFWSPKQSSHFWTIDEKEAQKMIREQADVWIYEGVAYYAFPPYKQPWGTVPVYRFWWKQRGGHFFTASDEERDKLLKDPTWTYEGTVWYALAGPHGKPTALR